MTSPTDTALAPSPFPSRRPPSAVRVLVAVVVALCVAAGQYAYGNLHHFLDLRIYYGAVRWWAHGHSLYTYSIPDRVQGHLGYTYPPVAALLMYPMAWMSLFQVIVIIWILSALSYVLTTAWLVLPAAQRHGWPRLFTLCLAVPLLSGLEPIRETITFGQINLILALLVLVDLLVLAPRGSRLTGVGIGIASAIKLTPAIFILYLLVSRRYRATAMAAGTAVAATLIAAAVRWSDSWQYWTGVVWHSSRIGHVEGVPNQSLLGALSRLTYPHPAPQSIWLLLAVVVLCAGLWRAARAALAGDEVAGLTLAGVTGALISPVSWQHHLYWFVPAIVVLIDVAATRGAARRWWYAAFAAFVWCTVTYSVIAWYDWKIVPARIMFKPQGQVIDDWHMLLMLVILAVLPVQPRTRSTNVSPPGAIASVTPEATRSPA